jgi:ArsR family transcriptional regulator
MVRVMPPTLRLLASRFKALSESSRLDILALLLHHGEMCVCDVESVLAISQSRASRHLTVLAQAGFVEGQRAGMWVHYRVVPDPDPVVAALIGVLTSSFPADRLAAISERLAEVRLAKVPSPACVSPFSNPGGSP